MSSALCGEGSRCVAAADGTNRWIITGGRPPTDSRKAVTGLRPAPGAEGPDPSPWYSNAPMSMMPLTMRGKPSPRWSKSVA